MKWLTDTDDVRDLVIRCVYNLDMKDQIPTIRKYVDHENEVIRISAIIALSQCKDEECRSAFEAAVAKSDSLRLQRAGKAALERLDKK